jgi:hypothetical protein
MQKTTPILSSKANPDYEYSGGSSGTKAMEQNQNCILATKQDLFNNNAVLRSETGAQVLTQVERETS